MTRQILGRVIVLALAVTGLLVPSSVLTTASSAALPERSIAVSGAGVSTYPAFSPTVRRYGVTTTGQTRGAIKVTATTSDPAGRVWVDGRAAGGPVRVTGLEPATRRRG